MKNKTSAPNNKKPWPTKEAMEQVYEMNLWGTNNTRFYSGTGSHQPEIVQPYLKAVRAFLTSFKTPIAVLDLGCGDFNIGKELVAYTKKYTAIDIVPALIAQHKNTFKSSNLDFVCLDIAKDVLPTADCVIIRQVLQHLSNAEIQSIVAKLTNYKYVILTEHLPIGNFIPNKDKISGQGIRLKKQSGVHILEPPFNFKVKNATELLNYKVENNKGVIVTWLLEVC